MAVVQDAGELVFVFFDNHFALDIEEENFGGAMVLEHIYDQELVLKDELGIDATVKIIENGRVDMIVVGLKEDEFFVHAHDEVIGVL